MNNSCNAMNFSSVQTNGLTVSLDGYIRMSPSSFLVLSLKHFLSGLDDDIAPHATKDGTQALICGYTEWLSVSTPAVTIGWDWNLDLVDGRPCYVRTGLPRSNVMLIDEVSSRDLGSDATSALTIIKIDQSDWKNDVRKHIDMRYA